MTSKRVAAIDCGTNSIRLLIAEQVFARQNGNNVSITDLTERLTRINRLGYGVDKTGEFDTTALERTFEFEREFAEVIAKFAILPENIRFVATSASRDAKNREVFFSKTREILGVTPEVISGDEEAKLSFAGVANSQSSDLTKLVTDLGGGSTELIIGKDKPEAAHSMNIGSVRITERYFGGDEPPLHTQIDEALTDINTELDRTFAILNAQKANAIESVRQIIGVAGTITTLTAHALNLQAYSREKVNGQAISRSQMITSANAILASNKAELRAMPFMHPGRVDVIQAGALIWRTLLERFPSISKTLTSEHDILDGIAMYI